MLTLVPPIVVPSMGTLTLAVQASSFHSTSIDSFGVKVAVRELSSESDRSHSTDKAPPLENVGEIRLSSSICCETVISCSSLEAVIVTLVSSLLYPITTSASSVSMLYLGLTVTAAPSESKVFVASILEKAKPESLPSDPVNFNESSSPSLASISRSALSESNDSTSARAETPHPPRSPLAFPQMDLGREPRSPVARAASLIPASRSTSPLFPEVSHEIVGSSPSRSAKLPSFT
mmetsp:Transcript_10817/g.15828  ORF Transcript_10817/g.15828 Transcript_10817/m.15828 type:complete len:234 (+) Transcript_10817:221-922(+)